MYQGGGGGATERAQVEAVMKDLVEDLLGAKVETQANIVLNCTPQVMFELLDLFTKAGCRLAQDLKFGNNFTDNHPEAINSCVPYLYGIPIVCLRLSRTIWLNLLISWWLLLPMSL